MTRKEYIEYIISAVITGGVIAILAREGFTGIEVARIQLGMGGQLLFTCVTPILIGLLVILMLWPWSGRFYIQLRFRYLVTLLVVVPLYSLAVDYLGRIGMTAVHISRTKIDVEETRRITEKVDFPVFMEVSSHTTTLFCRNRDGSALKMLVSERLSVHSTNLPPKTNDEKMTE